MIDDSAILITGGTGTLGHALVSVLKQAHSPRKIVIFSRGEFEQARMRRIYPDLRYMIGDVRDRDRLVRAMNGIDYVIHAAALKQVPTCEYNPSEAIQTNVNGAINVVFAAIQSGVRRVIGISSDKAVEPVNLYGFTKGVGEKLFTHAHVYSHDTIFSLVRYGNILGSRGSVVSLFQEQAPSGVLTITEEHMTRFWWTAEAAARFVLKTMISANAGEIHVPKIPSMCIADLARVIAPGCEFKRIGLRPGEKRHEVLISANERRVFDCMDHFVIEGTGSVHTTHDDARPVSGEFVYSSATNGLWWTTAQMTEAIYPDAERRPFHTMGKEIA